MRGKEIRIDRERRVDRFKGLRTIAGIDERAGRAEM
jgi:hypothetical protein